MQFYQEYSLRCLDYEKKWTQIRRETFRFLLHGTVPYCDDKGYNEELFRTRKDGQRNPLQIPRWAHSAWPLSGEAEDEHVFPRERVQRFVPNPVTHQLCELCNGEGTVKVHLQTLHMYVGRIRTSDALEVCERCDGYGYVKCSPRPFASAKSTFISGGGYFRIRSGEKRTHWTVTPAG